MPNKPLSLLKEIFFKFNISYSCHESTEHIYPKGTRTKVKVTLVSHVIFCFFIITQKSITNIKI